MKLDANFDVEPLLLIKDKSFANKQILKVSQIIYGDEIPEIASDADDADDRRLDLICNLICDKLKNEDIPFIVIQQKFFGESFKDAGIRLVSHIRLSSDEKLNQIPIVILTANPIDQLSPKSQNEWEDIAPLFSKGVRFTPEKDRERRYEKNESLLIYEIEKLYQSLTKDGKNEIDLTQFTKYETPSIPIGKPSSSHQVTNDWGAYRLIQAAGLNPRHDYPKHLYFKYLERSSQAPKTLNGSFLENKIGKNIRILLIDDNYNKGWKDSIELIIKKYLLKNEYTAQVDALEYADEIDTLISDCSIETYDLIYLDLRLPKSQDERGTPSAENGKQVLKKVKECNPIIPVIMFTASTKATNMDDLYEKGIDGYFVKESPETRIDPDFSKKNLSGFIETTRNCLNKGALLQPYWKQIQQIKQNNFIRSNERLVEGQNTKFEKRVIERLTMFIGLLKKSYEQTSFDTTTYYYEPYSIAYLSLWSVLNDIVAAYYDLDSPSIVVEAKTHHDRHRDKPFITYPRKKYRWTDRILHQVYVELDNFRIRRNRTNDFDTSTSGHYNIEGVEKSVLTLDSSTYIIQNTPHDIKSWVNYQITLVNQVAFLIHVICDKYGETENKKNQYWSIILRANDIRNKLWLTHSDILEDNGLLQFTKTLQEERDQNQRSNVRRWQQRIDDLFSVIEFLVRQR